jgi:MoxR-vWA-beta-propeller ternary system domain bpX0
MNRVADYWYIPQDYVHETGGVRWDHRGDTLIRISDDSTLAFAAEVGFFLEGFMLRRPVIHFGCVILLLDALRQKARPDGPSDLRRLGTAIRRTPRNYRNAGAFCAILCDSVPSVPDAPSAEGLWLQRDLQIFSLVSPSSLRAAEVPPLSPSEFRNVVGSALARYADDEIEHWLKHGTGPLKSSGEEITRELLAAKPPSLESVLADLLQRPRLSGAVPFIAQVTGALCLPPRQLDHNELPQGGYSDVTTRGRLEQLLPSQFALDELEFLRRFAEKELLYYRREEPQAPVREELIVLLDQGVRTWGPIRLLLAATLFALGKAATRRQVAFRLAATGDHGTPHDPIAEDGDALAELLGTSDLSAHPGLALERVLEEPATGLRDVVLLTQPRNLAEPDVRTAALRAVAPTRLFAVAADEHGAVEISEVKHGVPLALSRFRVDMIPKGPPLPAPKPARASPLDPWKGDVEPVPYPFRFGTAQKRILFHYDFDESGDWLLNASHDGTLHLMRTEGSGFQILPRGMVEKHILNDVHEVRGVVGGFVVGGIVKGVVVAAHYDLGSRICRVHALSEVGPAQRWASIYYRDLHSLVAFDIQEPGNPSRFCGLELASAGSAPATLRPHAPTLVALQAIERAKKCPWSDTFEKFDGKPGNRPANKWICLDPDSGTVSLGNGVWIANQFTPMADGKPLLAGCTLQSSASQEGHSLVFFVGQGPVPATALRLMLFRLPEGIPSGDYLQSKRYRGYALSRDDGRWIAFQDQMLRLVVRDTTPGCGPKYPLPTGEYPECVQVELGRYWLAIGSKDRKVVFRWDRGRLQIAKGPLGDSLQLGHCMPATEGPHRKMDLDFRVRFLNGINDTQRFVAWAENILIVGLDRFGQIALFNRNCRLLCMFFVLNRQVAVWMADDVCFGSGHLLGRSPTPGAAEIIGRTLFEATQQSKGA